MSRKRFGLYLVRPEDIGAKEKYFLITPEWTLLYTDNKPPEPNREVTDLKTMLPDFAVTWLNDTIQQMREEYLRQNAEEILRQGKAFTERFEAELKAEMEKLAEKESEDDG